MTERNEDSFSVLSSTATEMASSSVVPHEEKPSRKPAVQDIVPPVDFSFLHITTVDECQKEDQRDLSNVLATKKKSSEEELNKSKSQCLRLNNNHLNNVNNLIAMAANLFEDPFKMGWIDLSFNVLTNIDPVLIQFENLKILYLHANQIKELKEVNKLSALKKLWKLTIHGNEIEKTPGYRSYVLSVVPQLINFDFSRVTKGDRATADTWRKVNIANKTKKINRYQ